MAVPLKAGPLSATRCGKDHISWRRDHLLVLIFPHVTIPYVEMSINHCTTPITDCLLPAMHSQGAELVRGRVAKATAVTA